MSSETLNQAVNSVLPPCFLLVVERCIGKKGSVPLIMDGCFEGMRRGRMCLRDAERMDVLKGCREDGCVEGMQSGRMC